MENNKFLYDAKVLEVHDGDTISVIFDLGFKVTFQDKIRLYGINAPELKVRDTANKLVVNPLGTQTSEVLKTLLKPGDTILVETIKDRKEKYGRYLANIYITMEEKQVCLNEYLLNNGLATEMKY